MDLDAVRTFVAVADTGQFSAAALAALRGHLKTLKTSLHNATTWTPAWA